MGQCYFKVADPSEVVIKTGPMGKTKYVQGAATFICGAIHEVETIDLNIMTIELVSTNVMSADAVEVNVSAAAQVRIDRDPAVLQTGLAARSFGGLGHEEMERKITATLEGTQRAVICEMTMLELYSDKDKLKAKAAEVLDDDMGALGVDVISYTINSITDDNGYFDKLGEIESEKKIMIAEISQVRIDTEQQIQQMKLETNRKITEMEQHRQKQVQFYKQETLKREAGTEREKAL